MKEWFYYKEAYEKTNKPMAQQTAVEWLFEQYKKHGILFSQDEEQAKQMEKEQIMDAYNNGENRSAELYYKETYGK